MKKSIKYIIGIVVLLFIVGGIFFFITTRLDSIQCSTNIKEDNYKIHNTFKIYYKDDVVKKVRIEKEINSKNNTILSFFLKNYEDEFKKYDEEYGGYKISSKDGKNKKTLIVEWDLRKVDYDKLLEGRSYLKENIKKKKINIDGIYKLFQLSKNSCQ